MVVAVVPVAAIERAINLPMDYEGLDGVLLATLQVPEKLPILSSKDQGVAS